MASTKYGKNAPDNENLIGVDSGRIALRPDQPYAGTHNVALAVEASSFRDNSVLLSLDEAERFARDLLQIVADKREAIKPRTPEQQRLRDDAESNLWFLGGFAR